MAFQEMMPSEMVIDLKIATKDWTLKMLRCASWHYTFNVELMWHASNDEVKTGAPSLRKGWNLSMDTKVKTN